MPDRLILVADDEKTIREAMASVLGEAGYRTITAGDGVTALRAMQENAVDIALLDIRMPGLDGLQVLRWARQETPETQIIIITAFGSVESAVEAVKMGASDYVTKPFVFDDILIKLNRQLGLRKLQAENTDLRHQLQQYNGFDGIVGASEPLRRALEMIRKLAGTRSIALITGESGTGKELAARALHNNGLTSQGRFLPINCAALPETLVESELFGHSRGAFTGANRDKPGLFEQADGGTIFLDEICSMPLCTQPKLLRAIEDRQVLPVGSSKPVEVNTRILCAANCNLLAEVDAGRFRRDLYYRLNIVEIHMPPLRERPEDIGPLTKHFVSKFSQEFHKPCAGLTDAALKAMQEYHWPGNVRELKNAIERAILLNEGGPIDTDDLIFTRKASSVSWSNQSDLKTALRISERRHVLRVLESHGWDKSAAAKAMNIALSSLYRKMDELSISKREMLSEGSQQ